MIRSPIKWSGGKYRLRKKIIDYLPLHKCYVEVFGGAGWVLFGKDPSPIEIFNDIDIELMNFFQVVKHKPEELIESFELELVSRWKFEQLREVSDVELFSWTEVDRAHRFYYLVMASWGGEFGSPRFQTSVVDGGHGNRLIGALQTLRERILPAHERLMTVVIENLDWRECIEKYDRSYAKHQVVMYLDPPYPNNNVNYNHNMRDYSSHEELSAVCRSLDCYFLLTLDNVPEVRGLFPEDQFAISEVSYSGGMPSSRGKKSTNNEVIITNYELPQIQIWDS